MLGNIFELFMWFIVLYFLRVLINAFSMAAGAAEVIPL